MSANPPPLSGPVSVLAYIENLLLQKGGWIGALGMTFYFLFQGVDDILMHDWKAFFHELAWESVAISTLAIFLRGKRNSTMNAQGFAEVKVAQPGPTIPSDDPAIRHAEVKVEAKVAMSESGSRKMPPGVI